MSPSDRPPDDRAGGGGPARVRWVLATAALATLLAACENDPQEVAALFPEVDPGVEALRDFETIYSDSARIKARVTGPEMLRETEERHFVQRFPRGVHLEFYGDEGARTSTLDARFGLRYEVDDRVLLRDSVVWESTEGDRLDTEELHWDPVAERIYSDRFVRLRQADKEITGVGFESNQDFSRAKVLAIQGIVQVADGAARPNRDTSARVPSPE